jgi:hypothetical protein
MTSTHSGHVLKKLTLLGMVEEIDFTLTHVCERGSSGALKYTENTS